MSLSSLLRQSLCALAWILALAPAHATVSIYVPEDLLERSSTLILQATVRDSESGVDPRTGSVATYVTLDVERVLRGPEDLREVVLREPGGSLADRALDLDAVPEYAPGERVLVYLEPGPDGALRTSQMFFGKYRILPDASGRDAYAVRELDGHGRILSRPEPEEEWRLLRDLVARRGNRASGPRAERGWLAHPPELEHVQWTGHGGDDGGSPGGSPTLSGTANPPGPHAAGTPAGSLAPQFVPLQQATPARWIQSDSGTPVLLNVEPWGDPLGNPALAVAQIQSALYAWTAAADARITLVPGDLDYDYTGTRPASPGSVYSGVNIVLFGDPYDEISDPIGCAGVLAVGGYWRTTALTSTVNGIPFHSALQLYVTFNDGLECFLGDPENLAEVATHEIGHGLGFGHSTAPDAIMRSSAYGGRGARLGDDDLDAAHCHYPHAFGIVSPAGGTSWAAGTTHSIEWTASAESGPDPGTVDLEYTTDGGQNWLSLALGVPNSGTHSFVVPQAPGPSARVRLVRRHRGADVPPNYPEACSQAVSAPFTIAPPPTAPGAVPDGTNGEPLRLGKGSGGLLHLTWGPAISGAPDDYAIYFGSLASLGGAAWDTAPLTCSAGVDRTADVAVQGSVYFLVSALSGALEGPWGQTSAGAQHPEPHPTCGDLAATAGQSSFVNLRAYASGGRGNALMVVRRVLVSP